MTQSLSTPEQQTSLTHYTFIMYQIYHFIPGYLFFF